MPPYRSGGKETAGSSSNRLLQIVLFLRIFPHMRLSPLHLIAGICLFAGTVFARTGWQFTPEQLWPKAEVIVIGQVEDVEITRESRELRASDKVPVSVQMAKAKVRTLGVNKGELAFEFEFRFFTPTVDLPDKRGPTLVDIQPGGRYRFYLKKNGDHYISVLHGGYDDGYAVHLLAPGESPTALPTLDRDASPLARAEFRRLRPGSVIYASTPTFRPQFGWTYYFYCRPPLQYPAYAYEAAITINGARNFSPRSWVGKETPRPGAQLTQDDVGSGRVRITIDGDIREGVFYESLGYVTALIGQIQKIDADNLTGTFALNSSSSEITLTIPRKKLLSVQQLFSPDRIGSP